MYLPPLTNPTCSYDGENQVFIPERSEHSVPMIFSAEVASLAHSLSKSGREKIAEYQAESHRSQTCFPHLPILVTTFSSQEGDSSALPAAFENEESKTTRQQ